jgi:formate hydrogenlyase subunit 3/multisubunit Na+/H+ antiporter MnhD subunit
MAPLGKSLVLLGGALVVAGFILWGASAVPGLDRIGRLPGDIYLRRGNFSFYFPLTTAIIVSIVLSILLTWMRR